MFFVLKKTKDDFFILFRKTRDDFMSIIYSTCDINFGNIKFFF